MKDKSAATKVTAETCPNAWDHRDFQGRICPSCNWAIPVGPFTPAQMQTYFPRGRLVEAPKDSVHGYRSKEEEALDPQIAAARQAHEAAVFEIERLRRQRRSLQGTAVIDGQRVDVSARASVEAERLTAAIEAAKERAEELGKEEVRLRVEQNNLGEVRMGKLRGELYQEHSPKSSSGILQRVGAAIRGASAHESFPFLPSSGRGPCGAFLPPRGARLTVPGGRASSCALPPHLGMRVRRETD